VEQGEGSPAILLAMSCGTGFVFLPTAAVGGMKVLSELGRE